MIDKIVIGRCGENYVSVEKPGSTGTNGPKQFYDALEENNLDLTNLHKSRTYYVSHALDY